MFGAVDPTGAARCLPLLVALLPAARVSDAFPSRRGITLNTQAESGVATRQAGTTFTEFVIEEQRRNTHADPELTTLLGDVEAAPYRQEAVTFSPWEDIPPGSDLLFYEGLHGAIKTETADVARYADMLVGVVPSINLEWIQKLQSDRSARGHSHEAIVETILRRVPDYVSVQRVPIVDTSNRLSRARFRH